MLYIRARYVNHCLSTIFELPFFISICIYAYIFKYMFKNILHLNLVGSKQALSGVSDLYAQT